LSGIDASKVDPNGQPSSSDVPSYAQGAETVGVATTTHDTEEGAASYLPAGSCSLEYDDVPSLQGDASLVPTGKPRMLNEPHERGANPHQINAGGKKRALIIGINYLMTPTAKLNGCINDARRLAPFISEHFGFQEVRVMTDDLPLSSPDHPTMDNMRAAMNWLVKDATAGDSFFFHFSGHGGQCEDPTHMEEDDMNETILPADFTQKGQIVDDELHDILARPLPEGCRFTAIFDSCHSGTVMDLPFMVRTREGQFKNAHKADDEQFKNRHHIDKDNIHGGLAGVIAAHVTGEIRHQAKKHVRRHLAERTNATQAVVVQLSGCRDDQTSADTTVGNMATGAMSWAFIETLKKHEGVLSYQGMLTGMREALHNGPKEYSQFPQMSYGRPMDMAEVFTM